MSLQNRSIFMPFWGHLGPLEKKAGGAFESPRGAGLLQELARSGTGFITAAPPSGGRRI